MTNAPRFATLTCRLAFAALLVSPCLTGCEQARKAFGYEKAPPDEFAVSARAPLTQPPDMSLRPPEPGAPRPQDGGSVQDQAKAVLMNTQRRPDPNQFAGRSDGEKAMLTHAGADRALPGIRKKVNEETTAMVEADKSFTDKILFWREKDLPGEPVDPAKESRRIQENASLGRPATEGETPTIERHEKGWLEGIF